MNDKDMENDKLEHLLRRAHPSEPSPLLKKRITSEAKKAWSQSSLEIPWQIPVWRLAASAAAAVLIISITNFSSDLILKRWHTGDILSTQEQLPKPDILTEMAVRPFVRHLVSINRKPSITKATALRDYTKRVQQVLNEMQQNGASNGQDCYRSRFYRFQAVEY